MILAIPASLCRVQELTENSLKICLKRQRHRQNSTSDTSHLALRTHTHTHTHLPTKRAGAVWLTLVWKHSGEVGGWHHSTLQENKCLGVWTPFKHAHKGTYTHTYTCIRTHSPPPPPPLVCTNRPHRTCTQAHTKRFLARNKNWLSWGDFGVVVLFFPTSWGGAGAVKGEPMVGWETDTPWQDLGAEVEKKIDIRKEKAPSSSDAVKLHQPLACLCIRIQPLLLGPRSSSCDDSTSRQEVWLIDKERVPPPIHTAFTCEDTQALGVSNAIERKGGRFRALSRRQVADAVIHQQKTRYAMLPKGTTVSSSAVIKNSWAPADKYALESCKQGCLRQWRSRLGATQSLLAIF